jgi:hypothetical protein
MLAEANSGAESKLKLGAMPKYALVSKSSDGPCATAVALGFYMTAKMEFGIGNQLQYSSSGQEG